MAVQEKTKLANEVTKHEHSKINEYLEKDAFKSHPEEMFYGTIYNTRIVVLS